MPPPCRGVADRPGQAATIPLLPHCSKEGWRGVVKRRSSPGTCWPPPSAADSPDTPSLTRCPRCGRRTSRYAHPIATPRPVKDAGLQGEPQRGGVVLVELGRFLAVQRQSLKEVHALPHVLVRVVRTENDLGHPEGLSRAVERRWQVVAAGRHPHVEIGRAH